MASRDEMIDQITECIRQVGQAVEATTTPEWLRLDLTMAQLKGLFVLATSTNPITVGAMAQGLGIQLPGASHVADRLVQLGLAERHEDPEDRRRTLVRLSTKGTTLVEQLRQGRRERFHGWLEVLDDGDLAALHQGLAALANALPTTRCQRTSC